MGLSGPWCENCAGQFGMSTWSRIIVFLNFLALRSIYVLTENVCRYFVFQYFPSLFIFFCCCCSAWKKVKILRVNMDRAAKAFLGIGLVRWTILQSQKYLSNREKLRCLLN
jgi:hypothetical protein